MLKKILATALAAAMIFGLATTAFASFSDTVGVTNEKAIMKLASLGVLGGYPDGSFKPLGNITRAEMAAVVVRALGYESSAVLLTGAPAFSDCADAEWAWGYINVATSQNIIKGYPDGTFAPNANVTVAEAITMLVRALGRDAQAVGVWPTGHILVASQQGMLPSDLPGVDVAATRGIVAQLTANVYNTPFGYQDEDGQWQSSTATFLTRNSSSLLKGRKVVSVDTDDSTIEVQLLAPETANPEPDVTADCKFVGGSKLADFVNQTVDVILNDDGDAVYIGSTTTSGTAGVVTAVSLTAKTITIGGTAYTVKDTADVTINAAAVYGDAVAKITNLKDADVSLVLDSTGKVTSIIGTKLGTAETIDGKVTKYEATGTVNYVDLSTAGETALTSTATIIRNGASATYADLQIGDSVKFAKTGTKISYIDAFRMEIKGVLQEKSVTNNHATYKVNDVVYTVALTTAGADVDVTDPGVLAGQSVTLVLDRAGKVTNVDLQTGATTAVVIQSKNEAYTSTGIVQTLTLSDGSVVTMDAGATYTRNGNASTFAALKTGDTVLLHFAGTGKADDVKAYASFTTAAHVNAAPAAPVGGMGTVNIDKDSDNSDLAGVPFKVGYSTILKNGIQTVVTSEADFPADAKIRVSNWTVSSAVNGTYGHFVLRDTDEVDYVFKGLQTELEAGEVETYLVLRKGTADTFVHVTPSAILHRADAVITTSGLVVGDKVVFEKIVVVGGDDGLSLAEAWETSYLNAVADADEPEITSADVAGNLDVDYSADEQHIASFKVYNAAGTLLYSSAAAEKAPGANEVVWDGTNNQGGAVPAAGDYTLVLSCKDYAGNVADPITKPVTK